MEGRQGEMRGTENKGGKRESGNLEGVGGGDQHTRRQQPSDAVLRTCDWTKLRPTNQSPGIQIIQSPPVVCPAPFLLLHGLHQATGQRTTREEVTNPPLSLLLLQLQPSNQTAVKTWGRNYDSEK